VAERRQLISYVLAHHPVSERQDCRLLGLSRSVYRYQAQTRDDAALESALQVPAAPNECWSLDFMSDTAERPHDALGGLTPYQFAERIFNSVC